jgi:hypothetical protein
MRHAAAEAAPCQPAAESLRMVIATRPLSRRCASEFSAPHDERVVQQAAAFQILQQARDRLIDLFGQICVILLDLGMGVPFPSSAS